MVFSAVRGRPKPTPERGAEAARRTLAGNVCLTRARDTLENADQHPWPLAYVLAWLQVAGTGSIIPPWVLHQFPGCRLNVGYDHLRLAFKSVGMRE